eukprot:scaffold75848_cov52-Attheya_sp.AAC.1
MAPMAIFEERKDCACVKLVEKNCSAKFDLLRQKSLRPTTDLFYELVDFWNRQSYWGTRSHSWYIVGGSTTA